MERYETVIIGGGQAVVSVGYHLQKQSRSFVILEREGADRRLLAAALGFAEALLTGVPGRTALAGMRFPAERIAYPTKDEFANYLG